MNETIETTIELLRRTANEWDRTANEIEDSPDNHHWLDQPIRSVAQALEGFSFSLEHYLADKTKNEAEQTATRMVTITATYADLLMGSTPTGAGWDEDIVDRIRNAFSSSASFRETSNLVDVDPDALEQLIGAVQFNIYTIIDRYADLTGYADSIKDMSNLNAVDELVQDALERLATTSLRVSLLSATNHQVLRRIREGDYETGVKIDTLDEDWEEEE